MGIGIIRNSEDAVWLGRALAVSFPDCGFELLRDAQLKSREAFRAAMREHRRDAAADAVFQAQFCCEAQDAFLVAIGERRAA
jgi:hypothetical protein